MPIVGRVKTWVKRSREDEHGGATVEFMLWVPVFTALMTGAIDVGTIFTHKSNYWSTARDTARLVARHAMTESAATAYAKEHATFSGVEPTVSVSTTTTDVTVRITGTADTIASFGIFDILDGATVQAEVTYALEPI